MTLNRTSVIIESIKAILRDWWPNSGFSSLYLLGSLSTGEQYCSAERHLSDVDLLAIDNGSVRADQIPEVRRTLKFIWQHNAISLPRKVGLRVRRPEELQSFAERMYLWGYAIDRHSILLFGEATVFPKYEDTVASNPINVLLAVIERLFLDLQTDSSDANPLAKVYTLSRSILDALNFAIILKGDFLPTHGARVAYAKESLKDIPVPLEDLEKSLNVKLGRGTMDYETCDKTRRYMLIYVVTQVVRRMNTIQNYTVPKDNWHFLLQRISNPKILPTLLDLAKNLSFYDFRPNDKQLSSLILFYSYLTALNLMVSGRITASDLEYINSFDHLVLSLRWSNSDCDWSRDAINCVRKRVEQLGKLRFEHCQLARRDWA